MPASAPSKIVQAIRTEMPIARERLTLGDASIGLIMSMK